MKKIEIPYHVHQYEVFIRRLKPGPLRDDLTSLYKRAMAGFRGEQSLDYPLSYLPNEEFSIFHNLRLFDGLHHFQIDFLVLCSRFALILEVKNIIGKLTFDTDLNQLIRELDDATDVYDDPILQAEYLKMQLGEWLDRHFGISVPIVDLVVIASSAQLQVTDLKSDKIKKIVRRAKLKAELLQLNEQFTKEHLSPETMKKVADQLLANHHPRVIKKFTTRLKPDDLIQGVQCPDCGAFSMMRKARTWYCHSCDRTSKNAHIEALYDYLHIYGPKITNKKCREFLKFNAESTVKKLLHTFSERYEGGTKSRTYFLSKRLLKTR
ncbi:nuclease-related domain-containing protein [Sporolactobacillus laevolacticus]|uniref:nuclease-related domain-containing protein n=1 Tax=Sporolactobacillus laevolacticus TaxID=33018 RepID=UPI0025B3204D|nr:nuclease-related domain-containing protein [Sporolactobacillus laevolacticus]MDN3955860.1 nuclease-related domain-containing protein [Sporolactobacillus laevolacticus]